MGDDFWKRGGTRAYEVPATPLCCRTWPGSGDVGGSFAVSTDRSEPLGAQLKIITTRRSSGRVPSACVSLGS